LERLKGPELEKLLSAAQSLASTQELKGLAAGHDDGGHTFQQRHGYSHLNHDYSLNNVFNPKSEGVKGALNPQHGL